MTQQVSHSWSHITDLPQDLTPLINPQVGVLVQAWQEQAGELRQKDAYKRFLVRLRRKWAIETGILERLYDLSEGATKTLIEKGLDAALISHQDTDGTPEEVVAKIKDHNHVIEGLYQFVSAERPLSKSYIRELHQALTLHQKWYDARDTLGNEVKRELPHGEWKKLANNVEGSDGFKFEFCPPEHVDSEMERLLEMHEQHERSRVSPEVEAAWLHHRFSLIHPFTDGNGRVARCLATLVLLKANWLPLVVTRHERTTYILALRAADQGDLGPLVTLFGTLQRKAVREALSLSEEVAQDVAAIGSILKSVKSQFDRRRHERTELMNRVRTVGDALQTLADQRLREVAQEVNQTIGDEGPNYKAFSFDSPRGGPRAQFHYHQIIQCANKLDYYANLSAFQAWAAIAIVTNTRTEILFSFHGIGREWTGVLTCSAMAYTKETTDTGDTVIGDVVPLSDEPFEFTYVDDPIEVRHRFQQWMDERVVAGLNHWQKTL
ncbi:MAG: Fic family protein [Gemmataceae bacterium]|nr:Fic family protein [Gemmataceae bacterium]